ncbi:copper resistance protein CopC [Salicibibacter cibi]|uniref:Copper resistance protein CopC n=1 Tax=Salicibibacter cibi TaxID=2743001 RepID=A0A7T6ZDK1_9BACI|nr:copper resistance CopC family protein [Salicibibacter cibi]QQK81086.1 copper resistance protein CopC [Salicibibacter cibi]
MTIIKYLTILIITGFLSLSFMSITSAHSYVEESDPAEDSSVDEDIDTITLIFDAGIELATKATVFDDEGEEYEITDESVESPEYSATLVGPLPSGDYTVEWEALGEDGHTTEGEVAFTIDIDEAIDEEEEAENGTANVEEGKSGEEEASEENTTTEDASTQEEETAAAETTDEGGTGWMITAVLALIIIGAVVFIITRRNKA